MNPFEGLMYPIVRHVNQSDTGWKLLEWYESLGRTRRESIMPDLLAIDGADRYF